MFIGIFEYQHANLNTNTLHDVLLDLIKNKFLDGQQAYGSVICLKKLLIKIHKNWKFKYSLSKKIQVYVDIEKFTNRLYNEDNEEFNLGLITLLGIQYYLYSYIFGLNKNFAKTYVKDSKVITEEILKTVSLDGEEFNKQIFTDVLIFIKNTMIDKMLIKVTEELLGKNNELINGDKLNSMDKSNMHKYIGCKKVYADKIICIDLWKKNKKTIDRFTFSNVQTSIFLRSNIFMRILMRYFKHKYNFNFADINTTI